MAPTRLKVREKDVLTSDTTCYLVMGFKGEGHFGKVAKCMDLTTNKVTAVKIYKERKKQVMTQEIQMLQALRSLDVDKTNIVKFIESFSYLDLICIAFEMLDMSLVNLIKRKIMMTLNEIRPVVYQLMVALDALKSLGIMHTDLKDDNIMLVDHIHQPYKIKVIDFGLARLERSVRTGTMMQPRPYRAPEVYLGFPLSTAVDMWGVGCVMAHMYFGHLIFPHKCSYNWVVDMLRLLGQPDKALLDSGLYTANYFEWEQDPTKQGWTLISPESYRTVSGVAPQVSGGCLDSYKDLEHAVKSQLTHDGRIGFNDQGEFFSLLKRCLCVNYAQRITPRKALCHSFLTMTHLTGDACTSAYAASAVQLMTVSLQSGSATSDHFTDASKEAKAASNNAPMADALKPPGIAGNTPDGVDPVNRAVPSICLIGGSGDAPQRKTVRKRVYEFFGRVRSRKIFIFHIIMIMFLMLMY